MAYPLTLDFHLKKRPAVSKLDFSSASVREIVLQCEECRKSYNNKGPFKFSSQAHPGSEAMIFYLYNHAMARLPQIIGQNGDLGGYADIVDSYHAILTEASVRMFYYLLYICTRESRHERNKIVSRATQSGLFNPVVIETYEVYVQPKHDVVNKMQNYNKDLTIGEWADFLVFAFAKGSYDGGYGGKAWAKVAAVLRDFVKGDISAEAMLDTAFTLAHNNGPIFNKGMLYYNYEHSIFKVLDVQRAGQIPQLATSAENPLADYISVKAAISRLEPILSEEYKLEVDWDAVEKAGSLKKYPKEKAQQQKPGAAAKPSIPGHPLQVIKISPFDKVPVIEKKR